MHARCDTPFPSLEHALQGSKTSDPELHTQLNAISDTRELKRTALRLFKNTEKWNIKSVVIAEQLLRYLTLIYLPSTIEVFYHVMCFTVGHVIIFLLSFSYGIPSIGIFCL